MKILITGATGLIGGEIVSACHKKGYSVHYLSTSKSKLQNRENYKGFYWNPNKNKIDLACFKGVDAVINLAGVSISKRWTATNKKKILNSRVKSLQTLNEAIGKVNHNIASFVSASAIGIYPNSYTNYYEEDCQEVDDSFLGRVVEKWEEAADQLKIHGFPVSKIRTGLVLSEDGGALPQMAKPIRYYAGAVFGNGEQWQSWIHIKDIASLYLHIIEKKLEGVYNGVAPNSVTNLKLTHKIADIYNKPILLPNIPMAALKLVLGDMAYILYASQRVSAKKVEESGFQYSFTNICLALKDILQEKSQFQEELA
ncbi:TIGR01777 family oxidoreductase [Galbibacter mesophilus]|uniref:TIGR01777 family oxidoreductase n=1 Tax=Galbibacter mesophilus TaxID=379069 RepID=UPI00191D34F2|nr:TIGR01777 family oxidoreductase [Galbibacter mesophilus]MCM5663974.1 TIGR01777 family oxidoreductase [Galbibacter mesophilus]